MPEYIYSIILLLLSVYNAFTPETLLTTHNRYRLSTGASERIQLTALLGAFKNAVELSGKTS